MSIGWHIFRILCLLQMLAAAFFSFTSLINFFNYGRFVYLFETLAYAMIASFAAFSLNLVNTNYPDKPVAGKQKSVFNWLYLFNFLLLAFLFAQFFSAYRLVEAFSAFTDHNIFAVSFSLWLPALVFGVMLLFQFILLYGLYILRRLVYLNFFSRQQFEFEEGNPL